MSDDVSKSLLDLQPLTDPGSHGQFESAIFYVVLGSGDYQISWATLLQTINKTRLGLANVNNTADSDKPVSTAQQQALDLKANSNDVPTNSQFTQLTQTVSQKLDIDTYNLFVDTVNEALFRKLTTESFQLWLTENFVPLYEQNGQLAINLSALIQDLSTNYTTTTGMGLAISSAVQSTLDEVNTRISAALTPISQQISANLQTVMGMIAEDRAVLQSHGQTLTSHGQQISDQVNQLNNHDSRISAVETFIADGVKFLGTNWQ